MDTEQRDTLASYGAPVLAEAQALERELPPPLWERVAALLRAVDNATGARVLAEVDAETAAILAHFPGIAPAWQVVWGHLRNEHLPPCTEYRRRGPALLEPLEPVCTLLEAAEATAAQESA